MDPFPVGVVVSLNKFVFSVEATTADDEKPDWYKIVVEKVDIDVPGTEDSVHFSSYWFWKSVLPV